MVADIVSRPFMRIVKLSISGPVMQIIIQRGMNFFYCRPTFRCPARVLTREEACRCKHMILVLADVHAPWVYRFQVILVAALAEPTGITLGDAVELRMLEGGRVAAYALSKERWIFLFGKGRLVWIGTLGEQTASLLRRTLARNSHLRVRIVELTTSKLSGDKKADIAVSVWGDTKALVTKGVEPFSDQCLA